MSEIPVVFLIALHAVEALSDGTQVWDHFILFCLPLPPPPSLFSFLLIFSLDVSTNVERQESLLFSLLSWITSLFSPFSPVTPLFRPFPTLLFIGVPRGEATNSNQCGPDSFFPPPPLLNVLFSPHLGTVGRKLEYTGPNPPQDEIRFLSVRACWPLRGPPRYPSFELEWSIDCFLNHSLRFRLPPLSWVVSRVSVYRTVVIFGSFKHLLLSFNSFFLCWSEQLFLF